MKRFNFLSVVIAGILMVAAVGCTTLTETQDDYNEGPRTSANRVYVDDPYRGTVVLERDPWTGRYYEVNSFGSYNNRYYRGYGNNNRFYGRGYGNGYYNRSYNRGNVTRPQPQQPTQQQREQNEKNKSDARKKVLGN